MVSLPVKGSRGCSQVFLAGGYFLSDKTITRHLSTQCSAFTSSLFSIPLHCRIQFSLFFLQQGAFQLDADKTLFSLEIPSETSSLPSLGMLW